MIEVEVWAVDVEEGGGLLDQVGRIRADGPQVLLEGHWAEFVSRRAIPDLLTGEEIVIADDPERWVASLTALIHSQSPAFLHASQRITLPVRNVFGETATIEWPVDTAVEEHYPLSAAAPEQELREQAAQLAAEARAALPEVADGTVGEVRDSRTRRPQNA